MGGIWLWVGGEDYLLYFTNTYSDDGLDPQGKTLEAADWTCVGDHAHEDWIGGFGPIGVNGATADPYTNSPSGEFYDRRAGASILLFNNNEYELSRRKSTLLSW